MRTIIGACVAVCLATPAAAQDKTEIDKLNGAFASAFNKGDIAGLAEMYTEDAYVLPPGSEMRHGRSEIAAFWGEAAKSLGDLKLSLLDVQPLSPDTAREIGRFSARTKVGGAEVVGKYVVLWRKTGGGWRLATDIWNADK